MKTFGELKKRKVFLVGGLLLLASSLAPHQSLAAKSRAAHHVAKKSIGLDKFKESKRNYDVLIQSLTQKIALDEKAMTWAAAMTEQQKAEVLSALSKTQLPAPEEIQNSGDWQSNVINGLASVISKNFRRQLVAVFFDRMKNFLEKQVPIGDVAFQLKDVFSETYDALKKMDLVPISSLLTYFKDNFSNDLATMPKTFMNTVVPKCLDFLVAELKKNPKDPAIAEKLKQFIMAVNGLKEAAKAVPPDDQTDQKGIPAGAVINVLSAMSGVITAFDPKSEVGPKIVQYGAFLVDLVAAQSAADVETAINNVVLPPGSYAKKNSHTLFLNSYVGLSTGKECLDRTQSWNGFLGGYAPVGLEWQFSKCLPRLFLQIIDLGALVSYRLDDPNAKAPTVGFQQIFSPGLFGVTDLGFMEPFVLGFGASVSPQLRSVTTVSGTTLDAVDFRLGAFFAMDIPLEFLL